MKFCKDCSKHYQNEFVFCPDCGGKLVSRIESQGSVEGINLGDDNVVAGDIIGEVNDYNILGDATFVKNEDETKKIVECSVCGKQCVPTDGYVCRLCGNFVCAEHFNSKYRKCVECLEKDGAVTTGAEKLSVIEKSIIASAKEKYYSVKAEEIYNSLAALFESHTDNIVIKSLYFQHASEFEPESIAETDPYEISTADELAAVIDANVRLKRFFDAEKVLENIDGNVEELVQAAVVETAELYLDVFNAEGDSAYLASAENILQAAGNSLFLQNYLSWSHGRISMIEFTASGNGASYFKQLYRRRRNLFSAAPEHKKKLLKASELEIPDRGYSIPLYFSSIIGRESGVLAAVLINDDACSRKHAVIEVTPALELIVYDAGSTNGTFINGERLEVGKETRLKFDDKLTVGETDIFIRGVS